MHHPAAHGTPPNESLQPEICGCQTEDVGNAAVWLCSDLASATTGEAIFVDGGVHHLAIAAPDEGDAA